VSGESEPCWQKEGSTVTEPRGEGRICQASPWWNTAPSPGGQVSRIRPYSIALSVDGP
jgi:hypothetical protein